jgi:hypothetical protein
MTKLRAPSMSAHRTEAARQSLTIGLHAVTEFNQTIRYADTKSAALAAVQALAVTVLAARGDAGTGGLLPTVLFTACLLGVLLSAAFVAAGQMPRLSGGAAAEGPNRLAFPSLATMERDRIITTPPLKTQREDVWRQAAGLAVIAMTKYRWLHWATVSTLATLATVLLWLGMTMWLK